MQIRSLGHQPLFSSLIQMSDTKGKGEAAARKPDGTPFTFQEASDLVVRQENRENNPAVKYMADREGDIFRVSGMHLEHMKHHSPIVLTDGIGGESVDFNAAVEKRLRVLDDLKHQAGEKSYQKFQFPKKPGYEFNALI